MVHKGELPVFQENLCFFEMTVHYYYAMKKCYLMQNHVRNKMKLGKDRVMKGD